MKRVFLWMVMLVQKQKELNFINKIIIRFPQELKLKW